MKRIGVIGAGESGVGAALLAKNKGYDVFVSDFGQIIKDDKEALQEAEVRYEEEGHTLSELLCCDSIVKSPGVPDSAPIVKGLLAEGKTVVSEIEFAFQFVPKGAKVVAITGSNGKTTTTNLAHHILSHGDQVVVKGGNLGVSFAKLLLAGDADIYIVELSSFQLDGIMAFRPDIAVILNITPDHLDRYNYNFDLYAESKFRITQNLKSSDLFISNGDDITIVNRLIKSDLDCRKVMINSEDYLYRNYQVDNTYLRGEHNGFNATVAIHIAKELAIDDESIKSALSSFVNDDHRMQLVRSFRNVEWINDSKATNVDSCYYALASIDMPIIWIVGGVDKGNDYSLLSEIVKERVKIIIALGKDNSKIIEAFDSLDLTILSADTMQDAVTYAKSNSVGGDAVLLSPACSSFDLFDNYKDRGNQFIDQVRSLVDNDATNDTI